jgi:phosphoglycerol transferase
LQANFYGRQNAKVDWMKEYYKQPSVNFDKNHKPKNLIIIYVESLDNFRVKSDSILRRELNSLAVRHFSIQPGTQWTLAGIIASQCGVPILPVGLIASHGLMETREPLKNAVCLGDILSKEGYYIEFIGGANPEFAGKGNFLKKHGFNNVSGKSELNTLFPESKYPSDWWGHSDEVVLKHAKNRVAKLAKLNQPYFLNILTLDTHANAGNFFEYCEKQGHTNTIDQIFECSVKQVEEFYLWLYKNNYLENTVLIVMGDHPFMSRDFRKKIGGSKFRSLSEKEIFFGIKLPNDQKVTLESMTHFDIYPTTLSALGFELDNNAAGIGKNMLSKNFNNMSAKHKDLPNQLRRNSPDYLNLWRDQPN